MLEHEFNLRWYGQPISNQAAWGWLNSRSIPKQDKLQVLAESLKIEPEVLRFGETVRQVGARAAQALARGRGLPGSVRRLTRFCSCPPRSAS